MDFVLGADHPGVKQANKIGYRDGMLWHAFWKPGIPVGDKRILEHFVDTILETGNRTVSYAATDKVIKTLGEKAIHVNPLTSEWPPKEQIDTSPIEDIGISDQVGAECTLAKKIFQLEKDYTNPEEFIAIGGADIIPSRRDIESLINLTQQYPEADFIYPFLNADCLINRGLRAPDSKKLYYFRENKKRYHVATPNILLAKPSVLRLAAAATLADPAYRKREQGFSQSTKDFRAMRNSSFTHQWGDDSFLHKCMFVFRASVMLSRLAKTKMSHNALAGDFTQISKTVGHFQKEYCPEKIQFAIGDWHTLGYDIDTMEELATVKALYDKGEWF